jgi:molybdopterin converting factor small subunit
MSEEGVSLGAPVVDVTLPPALLRLFPEAEPRLALPAACVRDVIDALEARWPGMRDRLVDSTPRIRKHMNVFVDGRRSALDTPLRAGARVFIITAVSGG